MIKILIECLNSFYIQHGGIDLNHTDYIKNMLESFIKNTGQVVENTMFIKHYSTFNITLEEVENMVAPDFRTGLLYHKYCKKDIREPYEPFVGSIRYYYRKFFSDCSVEEFIDKCNVYSLHKEILISYIKTGTANRRETIIVSEIEYEKDKLVQSICSCLDYISQNHRMLIVLDRVQHAGLSSLNLINELLNSSENQKFKLLVIYNEMHMPSPYVFEAFNLMVEKAEENSILFEWDSAEEKLVNDYHMNFIPTKRYFSQYLLKLNNLFQMLAIEDAEYYMQIIYDRIIQEKFNVDDTDKFDFYSLRAYNYIYSDNINSALLMCEKMLQIIPKKDLRKEFTFNYISALSQMTRIQSDLALQYSERCIEIAEQLNDSTMIFYSHVINTSAKFCGWKDIFSIDFTRVTIDEKIVEELRSHKFYNTLAYYLVCGSDNDYEVVRAVALGERESQYFNEAIEIGRKLENKNFLLSAYTKNIIIYTEKGFHKYVNHFYKEKLKILNEENNTRRVANLYMGMGYNEIVSEQFVKANELFNKSFEILYRLKNVEVIAEGLYNIAINGICSRNFTSADMYIQAIFKMINNLGQETIKICNASKLYGLLALTNYRIGNEYRCYLCLSKIEVLISHLLVSDREQDFEQWHEDLFLYYFVKAIIAKNNEEYDEAANYFHKAEFHYESYPGAQFYTTTEYVIEYVDFCNRIGDKEKANQLLEQALNYCNKHGYGNKSRMIMYAIEGKNYKLNPIANPLTIVSLDQMIELSVNKGREKQLSERKKDIAFLSAWQEMLNKEELDEEVLLNNAMTTLQNNFNLDGIIVIKRSNNTINTAFRTENANMSLKQKKTVFEFFDMYKREFITNRTDKTFLEYGKIVSIFDINHVVTVVGIPLANEKGIQSIMLAFVNMHNNFRRNMILLNDANLIIMKTAFVQLANDLERIRNRINIDMINKKLNELAVTDTLTGLYNRQGFLKIIEDGLDYGNSITILYADLDNFKYYNDSFGHEVGDLILVEFAMIFKRVSSKIGYAVRYGGDEFVIVLKNVDNAKTNEVVKEIYDNIEDGFVDVIQAHMNKKVNIPKEKRVSCSIGIASSVILDVTTISETLKKADEALYYMKRNKKGCCINWEDINAEK